MKDYRTKPQLPDPEALIDWLEVHNTHRVGLYDGWLVIQPADEMDGNILCFTPEDDLDEDELGDLDYIKGFYTPEWEADNLNEAMEFIDGYDE